MFAIRGKETMKLFILILLAVAAVSLTSCKPAPVTGQIFIASSSGIATPIQNVQVLLIDAKEADDFLSGKKMESQKQTSQLNAEIEQWKSAREAAAAVYEKTSASNAVYLASRAFTNDSRYVKLAEELKQRIQTMQALTNAITALKSKYGEQSQIRIGDYTQEQLNAFATETDDAQRIKSLGERTRQIENELESLTRKIENERSADAAAAKQKVNGIDDKIKTANDAVASYTSADFCLSNFSPKALEMSLTDDKGNFVINQPKSHAKIFAKVKLADSKSSYYWLVDLPADGVSLNLSDGNAFKGLAP
jgi:archaellum component FlaC